MPYIEKEITSTKERLEDLRRSNDWSLLQLSEKLLEQGVFISHTNLRNYEINDKHHDLYNRTKGMSLENFIALADVYDVSLDYLSGRSNSKKAEYHKISEELHLSDRAIDLLKKIIDEDFGEHLFYGQRIIILSELLLDSNFITALNLIRSACHAYSTIGFRNNDCFLEKRRQNKEKLDAAEKLFLEYGLRTVDAGVLHDLYVYQALTLIDNLIREFPLRLVKEYWIRAAEDRWD